MDVCASLLRAKADRIAAATAASAERTDLRDLLHGIVEQLAEKVGTGGRLQHKSLRDAGCGEADVARLLRAVEGQSIELLREELDPKVFCSAVPALRECIRVSIPKRPVPLEILAFYRRICEGDVTDLSPQSRQVMVFFKNLVDGILEMVIVHDLAGNILYANQAALATGKYTLDELFQGLSLFDFIVPEYVAPLEVRLDTPGATFDFPYYSEVYARDGERIPVEVRTMPLTGVGEGDAVICIGRDLRREKRTIPKAQAEMSGILAAHVDKILTSSPIAMIHTNLEGAIQDANPTALRLCGAPNRDVLLGKTVFSCDGKRIVNEKAREGLREVLENGGEIGFRYSDMSCFEKKVDADVVIVPLPNDEGVSEGLLVLMADVSDRAALEASMVQMEKLCSLGEIVAGVAHELNNPLTGIVGYADLLLMAEVPNSVRTRVERIMHEAERSRRIVQNLLSFARHHTHEKSLHNVNDIVMDTLTLREHQLNVENIQIVKELGEELPKVNVDFHDVQRVFINMLNNAQHAYRQVKDGREKRIHIRTYVQGDALHIQFQDNGPGISAENQAKIFQAFFTTKPAGEGTGLGLSLSTEIVRGHGGEILLESCEGVGATFTIVLPIAKNHNGKS